MQNWFNLLEQLDPAQSKWILALADESRSPAGTVLVRQGQPAPAVFLIIQGLARVDVDGLEEPVAHLGPGEIVGEMSFLDDSPASASVSLAEHSTTLSIPAEPLRKRLEQDPEFGARWYRALALVTASRLRSTMQYQVRKAPPTSGEKAGWRSLERPLAELKNRLFEAEAEALKHGNRVSAEMERDIRERFDELLTGMNRYLGSASTLGEMAKAQIGHVFQRELVPLILLTNTAERIYSRPRGFAGDFFAIDLIAKNEAKGQGRLGPVLDRLFLDQPAAVALRNRRPLLRAALEETVRSADGTAKILSIPSGPVPELFDLFDGLEDASRVHATLVYSDVQAVASVGQQRQAAGLEEHIDIHCENLVYLALGKRKLAVPRQDLVYIPGLIDYFEDKVVIHLIDYAYELLEPGGRLLLTNIHTSNPSRALMDYILEWKLVHRNEADMKRLFEASKFARPCTAMRYEEQQVVMLTECTRPR